MVDRGGSRNLRRGVTPVPFLSCPLNVGPLKPAIGGLGNAVSFPVGYRAEPQPKKNFVNSKAVLKPLVEIILNILSTMFYSKTIKI